jgi:flagellar biosynthesis/type III secretory pathway M-ring protein FliF/YscJ
MATVDPNSAALAAEASAQAEVDRYTLAFNALQIQKNQLQQTYDLLTSARGLYTGVSDDLHASVTQFDSQIKDIQNQINITNHTQAIPSWWPWLNAFLNVLLVLTLAYTIYIVVYKVAFVHPVFQQIQHPY